MAPCKSGLLPEGLPCIKNNIEIEIEIELKSETGLGAPLPSPPPSATWLNHTHHKTASFFFAIEANLRKYLELQRNAIQARVARGLALCVACRC